MSTFNSPLWGQFGKSDKSDFYKTTSGVIGTGSTYGQQTINHRPIVVADNGFKLDPHGDLLGSPETQENLGLVSEPTVIHI